MRAIPRAWHERDKQLQQERFSELKLASPDMVQRVDAMRIKRGELPSPMTISTTRLAADIARAKRGEDTGRSFLRGLRDKVEDAGDRVADAGRVALDTVTAPARATFDAASDVGRGVRDVGGSALNSIDDFNNHGDNRPLDVIRADVKQRNQQKSDAYEAAHPGSRSLNPLTLLNSTYEGDNVFLREAARPSNYVPALPALRGLSFAPKAAPAVRAGLEVLAATVGTKASEEASKRLPEGMNPLLRGGLVAGAGIVAGGGAGIAGGRYVNAARAGRVAPVGMGIKDVGDDAAEAVGRAASGAAQRAAASFEAPPTVQRLYGSRAIREGDVRGRLEAVGESGRFRPDDPIVTPALRVRDESRQAVTNQATRVTSQARTAVARSGFTFDDTGRIPSLAGIDPTIPGAPTLRDVAARLPIFEGALTPPQRQMLVAMRDSLTPYRQALDEVAGVESQLTGKPSTIQVGSRADVMEGGFYIPRGTAETPELVEIALQRVGRGGRRVGGKQGFEKSAEFASEAEGIEAGYRYTPVPEAMGAYVRGAGNRTLDRHAANYFLSRTDDTGKRLAESRADRMDPELRSAVEGLRGRISGRLQTLRNQTVRGAAQTGEASRFDALANRIEALRERAAGRAGEMTSRQDARALNVEASAALRDAVARGRVLTRQLTNAQRATGTARRAASRTTGQIDDLTTELSEALHAADTLTGRGRGQIGRFGGDASTLPPEAAFEVKTAQGNYTDSLRAADRVTNAIRRLSDRAVQQEGTLEAAGVRQSTLAELRSIANSDVGAGIADLRRAGDTEGSIRALEREISILDREARRVGNRAEASGARASRTAAARQATIEEIEGLRSELGEINTRYQHAQQQAAATPRDQGTIPLAGLEAYSFPWELADEATRVLKSELAGQDATAALRAVNSLARGVQATGEMSYLGIQMAIGMVTDSVGFARAGKAATKAWLNSGPEVMGAYIGKFDERAVSAGRPASEAWAASGLRMAESGTEFQIGGTAGRVRQAVERVPLVKRADRGFGVAGDTMRLELADTLAEEALAAGRTLDPAEMKKIAESANRVTGWTGQRAGGSWGEALNFAPRYLAARVRAVGQLASADPRKRQLARRLVGRYIAIGTTMTVLANEARGEETDFRPFSGKNGPTFDPREAEYKNPNFVRVMNVAGRDWSLLGGIDSLVGIGIGITSLGTNPTGDPKEMVKRARGILSSPLLSAGLDWLMFGENFNGEELALNSRAGQIDIARRLLPFAIPKVAESGIVAADAAQSGDTAGALAEAAGGVAEGFFGGRGSRLTTGERVERGDYEELTGDGQFKALASQSWRQINATAPEQFKPILAEYGNVSQWLDAATDEYEQQAIERGADRTVARTLAESAAKRHPIYKAYLKTKDYYETEWVKANPEDAWAKWQAAMAKDSFDRERDWMPTNEQKSIIMQARAPRPTATAAAVVP